MQLGVFPLPVFLLPGGVTKLRIFEPRYLRLVKEAAGDTGFALTLYQPQLPFQTYPIGAWVKFSDFTQLDDGLLGVTVVAQQLVSLSKLNMEEDELRIAQARPISHWPELAVQPEHAERTAHVLRDVFAEYGELAELYPQPRFGDAAWVCGRLLELLPLPLQEKVKFYQPESFPAAWQLLQSVITDDQ